MHLRVRRQPAGLRSRSEAGQILSERMQIVAVDAFDDRIPLVIDGFGAPRSEDPDAVNRQPATLQCVVLRAAPADLKTMIGGSTIGTAAVVAFVNRLPTPNADDQSVYRAASPIAHVSAASPPTLLLHGDADDTVPYQQSVAMEAALRGANVPVKLVRVQGGADGSDFGTGGKPHQQFPDILRETVEWLDRHLRAEPTTK